MVHGVSNVEIIDVTNRKGGTTLKIIGFEERLRH